jgi:glycosyltransferase involved in cell wall biosynthesis
MSFPISVVYNSHMTQDTLPTLHDNMRMIPFVETEKFKSVRSNTIQNDVVCLINCNQNKGGELFKELANKMKDVQFLGVKGGYSNQVIDNNPPPNLRYIDNQKDIMVVFKKIGILVMPSKNETWGRTAVEAMSSGVPVIHSESAGLVECVGGAGIMCVHDDIDAWEDAIRRLISDRAYRERIRQHGFKRIEEIQVEQVRGRQELAMKIEA